MSTKDPRVDAYIVKSQDFAKPILIHIRAVVHQACPDVEETIKWNFPAFMYHGILCGMAAFKEHSAFGFWKGTLIVGEKGKSLEAMGSFGRMTKLSDLPSDQILSHYIKQAMELNEKGVKAPPKRKSAPRKPIKVPPYFTTALKKNKKAKEAFEAFSPSHQREYL